ncbi:hypothetical protein K438DRAFT_1780059 [Mycena galopus ATCC 62051]|nr:hypothetical protein K438DRAFT_1780059 [Mycena galopus ATCC 62051]
MAKVRCPTRCNKYKSRYTFYLDPSIEPTQRYTHRVQKTMKFLPSAPLAFALFVGAAITQDVGEPCDEAGAGDIGCSNNPSVNGGNSYIFICNGQEFVLFADCPGTEECGLSVKEQSRSSGGVELSVRRVVISVSGSAKRIK